VIMKQQDPETEREGPDAESRATSGLPISVSGVTHHYGTDGKSVKALEEVNLDVAAGEFVSILGPSGCGKSTLLQILAGLIRASSGQVRIAGKEVTKPVTDLGFVFQDATLLDWRTVMRNILLQAEVRKIDRQRARARATELLKLTRLEGFENAYPSELSGGMKQRVSICRALLHDPPLLLMDEPFGALDALTREQMTIDLQRIWMSNRKTVVFVTHSIAEAVFLADRIVVFSPRPGRVLETIDVDMPRPRHLNDRELPRFGAIAGQIRDLLMSEGVLQE
jgi:NitT/TauT family transport system ATP-binding protein